MPTIDNFDIIGPTVFGIGEEPDEAQILGFSSRVLLATDTGRCCSILQLVGPEGFPIVWTEMESALPFWGRV